MTAVVERTRAQMYKMLTDPYAVGVLAAFCLSRYGAYAAGIRFDASGLSWKWQCLDPALLSTRLLESLLYLHGQPPAFNLIIGVALRLFPGNAVAAIQGFYVLLGALASLGLYVLLRRAGCAALVASALAVAYSIAPATVLYENWLGYDYPAAVILVLAAVACHRFVSSSTVRSGALFFALCALLIYLRSVFQIVWLLPIVFVLMFKLRPRTVIASCAIPLLLVLALYAKNWILFGTPATSSWFGLNLSRGTVFRLDQTTRDSLADAGLLHGVSRVDRFASLEQYAPYIQPTAPVGIAALDTPTKEGGAPNFNALAYIDISRQLAADSLWVIRHRPMVYLHTVAAATRLAFASSTDHWVFRVGNRQRIGSYDAFINRYVYVVLPWTAGMWAGGLGLTILAAYMLTAGYFGWLAWSWVGHRRALDATDVTLCFVGYTVVYFMAVIVLTEIGENQRMRVVLDPVVLASCAIAVGRTLTAWRDRRGTTSRTEILR